MANKEDMATELREAQSLNEVLRVMNKYYDLDQKLGVMSKGIVLTGLQKVIKLTNTKER